MDINIFEKSNTIGRRSIILILMFIIILLLVLLLVVVALLVTECTESPNHFDKQEPNDEVSVVPNDVLQTILRNIQNKTKNW